MTKKLGQLLAKFNKEVLGAVNQNIKDLNNINDLIKQGGPKFIEYLDANWEVNTDADRKAKAEALEQIKGDIPLSGAITSFKEGFDEEMSGVTTTDDEVEVTEQVGPTQTAAGIAAGIESGPSEPDPDAPTQPVEVGSDLLDINLFEQMSVKVNLDDPTAIKTYIQMNPNLSQAELQFLQSAADGAPLRPTLNADGTTSLIPFAGHFEGTPVTGILDNYASEDEIIAFQNFLTDNNLVPQNYFAESIGESSEKLRTSIQMVMNWIDTNMYAVEGTETYKAIMEETELAPVYFSQTQAKVNDWSFARNLFNAGLKELAAKQVKLDEVDEAAAAKALAEKYIPPSQGSLEDMVEGYFEAKLGRKPTEEELDKWSTTFGLSYSTAWEQDRAKAEQLESYNFLTAQPEYSNIGKSEMENLQEQYPGRGTVDLSMFSIQTPAEIREQQFEDEYGNVVEATQNAKQVRKMQQDMLTYMFGG
tara:strand:+ start:3017 stop:4441 length:1425 start_codon:yes stop_codon:yes gene_type:complete